MDKNIQYTILTSMKTRIRQRTGGSKMVRRTIERGEIFVGKHDILGKLKRYLRGATQAQK